MELTRASSTAQLAAYLQTNHESLAALLPPDTTCNDLFGEVEAGRPIASFFNASDDASVSREFLRFTQKIELCWLPEDTAKKKAQQKKEKCDAWAEVRKEKAAAKKPKLGPPTVPTMAFEDAQLVAEVSAEQKKEEARKRLLEKGYTASFSVPGDNAADHQKFFKMNPKAVCETLGTEFRGESWGSYTIHFPGEALEAFEVAKRGVKSKVSGGKNGKPKVVTPAPYRDYKLPTVGEVITWQELFGTLVAPVFIESDVAAFKIVTKHSSAEIEELGKAKVREVEGKYTVKLERASSEIAAIDLRHETAEQGDVKEALKKQLNSLRATRNALLAKQQEEVKVIELKYDGYKETVLINEKNAAAKKAQAKEKTAAIFQRACAIGMHNP